jgi:hypothetical protein
VTTRIAIAAAATVAFVCCPGAVAGGSFERIVGVGAKGAWTAIELDRAGSGSDAVLSGAVAAVPVGGYVRVYPFIGGLPAIPGRLYPAAHVLCLYWHEPVSNCSRLSAAGMRLLGQLARLPLRDQAPTVPVEVRYRSRVLRYADGNIFAALELALERPARPSSLPPNAIALTVSWRGPRVAQLPVQLYLTPIGVYASGQLFALRRGPWCYLAENLRNGSAALIEATARICR